jgi:hypothetical protein
MDQPEDWRPLDRHGGEERRSAFLAMTYLDKDEGDTTEQHAVNIVHIRRRGHTANLTPPRSRHGVAYQPSIASFKSLHLCVFSPLRPPHILPSRR